MNPTLPRRGAVALAILAVAACESAPPPPPPPDLAAAEAEVRAAGEALTAAETAKDTERALTFWAPDAILQLTGTPLVQGTDSLRAAYTGLFSPEAGVAEMSSTTTAVHVAPSGDLAWEYGVNRMVMDTPEGRMVDMGKYMAIWQKQGGAWKIVALSATSDADAPMPAPPDSAAAPPM